MDNDNDNDDRPLRHWFPRDILRRTNWLYRVDALRPHDIRELSIIGELVFLYRDYAMKFLIWAHSLTAIARSSLNSQFSNHLQKIIDIILSMTELLWSEGYCYLLDYSNIAYYPSSNRFSRESHGRRFPELRYQTIDGLGNNMCREMTGLSVAQIRILFTHLRLPDELRCPGYYVFGGEEAMLHYLYWNRCGGTRLQMSQNIFGGDPRRFTYSIRLVTDHLYKTFYHKISGDSLRMWMPHMDEFRYALWDRLRSGVTVEEIAYEDGMRSDPTSYVFLGIPFDSFRIFGFLDDTGFRTSTPGLSTRRRMGFTDDVQRAFYSGYFEGHGLKVQAVTLPNGMFGSIFIGSWRESDSGLLNMSGLNNYLCGLFEEFGMRLDGASGQFPALYGDGIFPQLAAIVARYRIAGVMERAINRRMASIRQSIEHMFGCHHTMFRLFNDADRFRLLVQGVEVSRLVFNSFFLFNCYNCLNETRAVFRVRAPRLEEYIPLDEVLIPAPEVTDNDLGTVYNYFV